MTNPQNILKGLKLFETAQHLHAKGKLAEAAQAYARTYDLMPDHPAFLAAYGKLAEDIKDWPGAEKIYRRIGLLRPQSNFEGRLAICLFMQERFADAVPFFRKHFLRNPSDTTLLLPLAQSLLKENRWEEALATGRTLMTVQRNAITVELVLNCLINLGMREESDALVEQALREFPNDPLILALCGMHLLKIFDHTRGFALQPAIRRRYEPGKPDWRIPPAAGWDGKPFAGTLLIDGEQGLGEEILCASMFDELVHMQQDAIISCDPRLIPLFKRSFPALHFVSRDSDEMALFAQRKHPTLRFRALDLACLFRRKPFTHTQPWLKADPVVVSRLREQYEQRHPGKRHKAISWKTVRDAQGAPRSIKLGELVSLLTLPNTAWFNVQYGDYSTDIADIVAAGIPPPWDDLRVDQTKDMDALAAQLCAMDCLVSISNTTAHLAGALGVPCYLLLPKAYPVIWYWGYAGNRTPWYPSIEIYRNEHDSSWTALAEKLAARLRRNSV